MKLWGLAEKLRREKVRSSWTDINIGKRGIHEGLVNELKRVLDLRGCAKIKILRNARGIVSEEDIAKLATKVDAIIADSRGYTFILIARRILKNSSRRLREDKK